MKQPYRVLRLFFLLCCLFFSYHLVSQNRSIKQEPEIGELIRITEDMLKTDPSKAIYYASSAIIEAQRNNDNNMLAMAQALLGEAYMNQGDFDMGFEAIMKALDNCPSENTLLSAFIYVHLANSYNKIKDLNEAFAYIDKALAIYKQYGDTVNQARCYNSRGLIYIQKPDNEKAEADFKEALALSRKMNNTSMIAANLNNLCLYEGNADEKILLLEEAIRINKSAGAVWSLGENYNNLGTQYFYAGKYDEAIKALNVAMDYARKINAKELIADNYRYLSWVYQAKNNYKEAFYYLSQLYEVEQELFSKDEIRKIELNNVRKHLQAKEAQIVMQEQAFQIGNLRMRIWVTVLIAVAVLLILLYILIHYRHQKRIQLLESDQKLKLQEKELMALKLQQTERESQKIQDELDRNREELINFAFFVRSRNDLLANIQTMIKEGYKLPASQIDSHLRSIHAYISNFNARNTETEVLIDKVNALFIDKLSVIHPDLSRNEQRLASLLRIGLSTKEIAAIIDSTPKTVNMARYRLRKHLNLETDDSLTEYMKSL